MLPRLIGPQRASLMCLTGRRVKAEEGLPWGLVDEVVPLEELRAGALRLATEIAENAPLAVVATRKTLRGDLAAAVLAQTGHEHEQQTILKVAVAVARGRPRDPRDAAARDRVGRALGAQARDDRAGSAHRDRERKSLLHVSRGRRS